MKKLLFLALGLVILLAPNAPAADPAPYRGLYNWYYYGQFPYEVAIPAGASGGKYYAWAYTGESILSRRIKVEVGTAKPGTYSFTLNGWASPATVIVSNGAIVSANGDPSYGPFRWDAPSQSFLLNGQIGIPSLYATGSWKASSTPHAFLEGSPYSYAARWGIGSIVGRRPFPSSISYRCTPPTATFLPGMWVDVAPIFVIPTEKFTSYPARPDEPFATVYLNSADAPATIKEEERAPDSEPLAQEGDPVDAITGAHFLNESPIGIMGSIPWNFTVSYSSKAVARAGFAAGWSHPFESRVTANTATRVDVTWSHMEKISYYPTSTAGSVKYVATVDGHQGETLTRNANGTVTIEFSPTSNVIFAADGLLATIIDGASSASITHTTRSHAVAGNQILPARITDTLTSVYMDIAYVAGPDAFHPLSVTTNDGRTATFGYDATGRVQRITGANGSWIDFTFVNATALIAGAFRNDGTRIYENTFDTIGRVLTQKDGLGAITTFAYHTEDPSEPYTDVTDRTGHTESYFYDTNLRLLEKQNSGYAVGFDYDGKGFRKSATDSYGANSTVAYTPKGDPTSVTGADGATSSATYDANRNITSMTVPQGGKYLISYDANNDPVTITNPYGGATTIHYSAPHIPSSVTNPHLATSTTTYTNGRVTQVTDAAGHATTITYDARGLVASATNAAGGTTSFTYDEMGKPLGILYPDQTSTTLAYNPRGNLAAKTDQLGKTTLFGYDANSNLVSFTNALNQTSTFEYDAEDRLKAIVNPLGARSVLNYDASGHVVSAVDPTGIAVTYERDAGGRITGVKDSTGVRQATYAYDTAGRKTSVTDRNGAVTELKFNAQGDISRVVDALGLSKWLFFDSGGALSSVSTASGLGTSQQIDVNGQIESFYDAGGQKTSINHYPDGLTSDVTTALGHNTAFDYDALSLLSSIVQPSGATTTIIRNSMGQTTSTTDPVGTISYAYDARGTSTTVTEGPRTISREYDDLGRISAFVDGNGNRIEYAYSAAGHLTGLKYPGNKLVNYTYDAAGRMKTVTDWVGRVTSYSYDANGNLVYTTNANGSNTSRIYGADQSLRALLHGNGSSLFAANYFTYDALGRVTSDSRSPDFAGATFDVPVAMTYDADSRMATYAGMAGDNAEI